MIQEFQLRALPEQAISEQALKQFIGREKGLDIRTIHSIRVLKRSIDARQRTIYVNLKVRLYINEIPHDGRDSLAPVPLHYPYFSTLYPEDAQFHIVPLP